MKQSQTRAGAHPCPVCGDTERRDPFTAQDHHYRIKGEWTLARCVTCGLVQLDPMMTNEELGGLYPEDYYAFTDIAAKRASILGRLKSFLFRSLEVDDPKFPQAGRVLDSGCGSGWALAALKHRGWDCHGVDPSPGAVAFGRQRYGIDLQAGTVHTVRFPDAHFDYVRSNHSLEHDPEAGETIREFRRIIKPDGKLLIGVPNIDGAMAKLYGRFWYYLGAPVHTYNFNRPQLTRLLEQSGFDVERVRYCGNWGGVFGSLQIWLNRRDPTLTSADGLIVNTMPLRVVGQIVAGVLNAFGAGDCIEVVASPARTPASAIARPRG